MTRVKTKNVVVVTDCSDVAYQEVKWIIKSECSKLGIDDVDVDLVAVEEFSIINAAFLTRLIADQCMPETVISVIINPLPQRYPRIYGHLTNGVSFFGANTGALTWLIKDLGADEVFEINDPGFVTFGGKYVHAPNVAKMVAGVPDLEMGKIYPKEKITDFDIPEGTIVHIDNFGLMKIKAPKINFNDTDTFEIFSNGKYIMDAKYSSRMMSNEDNTWVLYCGSSLDQFPELGCVRNKHGFKEYNLKIGDIITWQKKKK